MQEEEIVVVCSNKSSGRGNCGSGCNIRNSIRGGGSRSNRRVVVVEEEQVVVAEIAEVEVVAVIVTEGVAVIE